MQDIVSNFRLVWRLVQDHRVPAWIRYGIPLLAAIYVISPFDVIPDFIPGLGEIDDLGVVALAMNLMVRFAPGDVVSEHRQSLGLWDADEPAFRRERKHDSEGVVDVDYRVVD